MHSGRETLYTIERALESARRELARVDQDMQSVSTALARARQEEAAIYRRLAQIRLQMLEDDELVRNLDSADTRADALLAERARHIEDLAARADAHTRRQEELQAGRQRDSQAVDNIDADIEELSAHAVEKLQSSSAYQELQAQAQHAVNVAAGAEEKTRTAEADRRTKGEPYEQDRLFSYLWARQFGTSGYRANLFSRFVDGIVARHIGYESARRNFHLLNEIPRRLREHTDRLEQQAAAAVAALAEAEREAERAAGIEPLEAELQRARDSLAATDAEIEQLHQDFNALVKEREQFARGEDRYFVEAVTTLVENFKAEPIPQLRLEADSTAADSDDALVSELSAVRERKQQLQQHLDDRHHLQSRGLARVNDLAGVRRQFKAHDYDAGHSVFDDRANLEIMLAEFLRGVIDVDNLWRAIRHSQRFTRRIEPSGGGDFGSVRIPKLPRGIRIPRGFGGGGGFKAPRMPRGFRTKGGF